MELKFEVRAKIARPRAEVFDAVYDPAKLSRYFSTAGAGGPLDQGARVVWKFADFPGEVQAFVKTAIPGERIVLEWAARDYDESPGDHLPPPVEYTTTVEMNFESLTPDRTLVRIAESGWRPTQGGLDGSYGNCQGWMNWACCLKAWVEYGINLREGFF